VEERYQKKIAIDEYKNVGFLNFTFTFDQVMEIRPNVNWDKGCALMYLLDTLGFDNFNNVLPIYLGDDRTDEDAFKVRFDKEKLYSDSRLDSYLLFFDVI